MGFSGLSHTRKFSQYKTCTHLCESVCVFILRWALRALPASAPSAGMKGMCHYTHPQVDLKCGSGRSYALYFLGEVFCESARDGEQPCLFR